MNLHHLLVHDAAGIRTVALNRPDSLNALNYDVIDELEHVLRVSQFDEKVRVLVLKGNGRAFCAGDDLRGMGTDKTPVPEDSLKRAELSYPRFITALRSLDKPVIAQVHGFALGAGCDLALSCDLIFAEEETKFGLVFAKRGMVSGTALLPRLVGYHKACELLFSGEMFTARQALQMQIINDIATGEELEDLVKMWASRLATAPTGAIGMMKKAINQSIGQSLEHSLEIQRYMLALSYHTHDYQEGKTAFVEKRSPRFIGR